MKNAALTHLRCATVANAEVSSGIVGYQQITVGTGYHLFTVTFGEVGNTAGTFNINGIKVFQNGAEYTQNNKVILQKMDSTGAYLNVYNYRKAKGGWCAGATLQTDVTVVDGEAVCINNTTGADIELQVAGEVNLNPWSGTLVAGYSLCGNMTPNTINLNDVVPYQNGEVYASNNKVLLQKMDSTGAYLDVYNYRKGKGGWCSGTTLKTDITLAPGESFCVNNNTGAAIQLKFKNPVVAE